MIEFNRVVIIFLFLQVSDGTLEWRKKVMTLKVHFDFTFCGWGKIMGGNGDEFEENKRIFDRFSC